MIVRTEIKLIGFSQFSNRLQDFKKQWKINEKKRFCSSVKTITKYLFPDITTPMEHSQFLLVEMESTTSLPILFISSYDNANGVFTVPLGGDGFYYFSVNLVGDVGEFARFDMRLNDDVICSTVHDHNHSGSDDYAPGSCSAVVNVVAGSNLTMLCEFKIFLVLWN